MNCHECEELLQRRLDDARRGVRYSEPRGSDPDLERHLAECQACRQTHAAAGLLLESLESLARRRAAARLRLANDRRRVAGSDASSAEDAAARAGHGGSGGVDFADGLGEQCLVTCTKQKQDDPGTTSPIRTVSPMGPRPA